MIGFQQDTNKDTGWNINMKIHSVNIAADFISKYGNVSNKKDELLNTKPTIAQLEMAKNMCLKEVEQAFALIKEHHKL